MIVTMLAQLSTADVSGQLVQTRLFTRQLADRGTFNTAHRRISETQRQCPENTGRNCAPDRPVSKPVMVSYLHTGFSLHQNCKGRLPYNIWKQDDERLGTGRNTRI